MFKILSRFVVAAVHHHPVAHGGDAGFEAAAAVADVVAETDFAVVDAVFGAVFGGGEVGHHHVGACLDAPFAAEGVECAQGGGGGQQHVRVQQPYQRQQPEGLLHAAVGFVGEGGVLGGDEGSYAAHLGFEVADEVQVLEQGGVGLAGRAHHKARAHLVADVAEVAQTLHPMLPAHLGGVEVRVVVGVGGLVAQQVAVGAGVEEALVAVAAAFAEREGDGAVWELRADALHQGHHPLVGVVAVLTALQHKGAQSATVAEAAAFEDGVVVEAVAFGQPVVAPDAAVAAVVAAVVAELDEAAHIDGVAVDALGHLAGLRLQVVDGLAVVGVQNGGQLFKVDILRVADGVNDSSDGVGGVF